jgi:hypothetical protein
VRISYRQSQLARIDLWALGPLVGTPVKPCEQPFAYPEAHYAARLNDQRLPRARITPLPLTLGLDGECT